MAVELGYLLPTRERVMVGVHETADILALGDKAEDVGLDAVWIGDSLLARPRHDPLTLAAAIAARTARLTVATGILLPALRNPVVLAQQLATIDQIAEGRFILGVGIASDNPPIRAEFEAAGVPFEKRVGRMLEGLNLCRALWSGDPVTWDGRWTLKDAVLAPKPHTPGGPKIWGGGTVPAAIKRCVEQFDGWFPVGRGGGKEWGEGWQDLKDQALAAGRDPDDIAGAAYVTLAINDDQAKANAELNAYMEDYYNAPAEMMRNLQYSYAGDKAGATAWLNEFVEAGIQHLCVRFTGTDDARYMEDLAEMRAQFSS